MIRRIIPGHVLGITWILALASALTAIVSSGRPKAVIGILLFVAGSFLADQATHLAQHHDDQPPTWIERKQLTHPRLFQTLGIAICTVGTWIAVS